MSGILCTTECQKNILEKKTYSFHNLIVSIRFIFLDHIHTVSATVFCLPVAQKLFRVLMQKIFPVIRSWTFKDPI
jgi:hypothetical protein